MIRDDVCEVLTDGFAGTGDYTLNGARSPRYVRFRDRWPNDASFVYTVATESSQPAANGPKREQGIGRLVLGTPDRIERVTVLRSSSNDGTVTWLSTDRPVIFVTAPLEALAGYLPDDRDPIAGDDLVTVNDTGVVFCHDVTAGNRVLSVLAISHLVKKPFFRFGVVGIGSGSNHVAVTPDADDRINYGTAGAAFNVAGNSGIRWFCLTPALGGWSTE